MGPTERSGERAICHSTVAVAEVSLPFAFPLLMDVVYQAGELDPNR